MLRALVIPDENGKNNRTAIPLPEPGIDAKVELTAFSACEPS
jgi:hypothetical protein